MTKDKTLRRFLRRKKKRYAPRNGRKALTAIQDSILARGNKANKERRDGIKRKVRESDRTRARGGGT